VTPGLKQAAYFIVSEALTNVAKHAQATECLVRVATFRLGIIITVADNGIGCPDNPAPGVGMVSMAERASELSGTCTVSRAASGGTEVRAFLPYEDVVYAIGRNEINLEGLRERSAN
jgi:signal transduction histidine kinase